MNMQLVQQVGKKFMKKVPVFKSGCTVRVHQRIKEGGKERIQIFEGLVIALNSGSGPDKTFTVRKMVGGIGVEKIFPLYSTNITKIHVTKSSDVRRAKLYYMRKRSGKSARLREKHLTEKDVVMEEIEGIGQEVQEEAVTDAPVDAVETTDTVDETVDAPKDAEKAPDAEGEAEEATEDAKAEEPVSGAEGDKAEEPPAEENAAPSVEEPAPAEEEKKDEDK